MDDGVVAVSRKAVARVVAILKELGPYLGLFLNDSKCEENKNSIPQGMKWSNTPNLEILGAPIRDLIFCTKFVANQCAKACALLSNCSRLVPKTHRLRIYCFASVAASGTPGQSNSTFLGC